MKLPVVPILIIAILFLSLFENSFSQRQPTIEVSVGLAYPIDGFGGDLVSTNDSSISFISEDFIKNNYGTSTGVTITGAIKFPVEQKGVFNGILMGSYTFYNAFQQNFIGVTELNNVTIPVTYENKFSTSTFGLGAEISPAPESRFSPFVNSIITFNFHSLNLIRNYSSIVSFSDAFRMGLLIGAGVEMKITWEYAFTFGGGYNFGNLLFKNENGGFEDRIEFNRIDLPINDASGNFYTNLSNPDLAPTVVNGTTKNINSWNLNLGLNILLGKSKKK